MSQTRLSLFVTTMLMLAWGCGGSGQADLAPGAEVTIEMPDGSLATGRVATSPAGAPEAEPVQTEPHPAEVTEPYLTEVTVPAGTTLVLALDHALASDVSQVEDAVTAQLRRSVMVDDRLAIPEGSLAIGAVTAVEASGKVRGRATLAFRFDHLDIESHRYDIHSDTVSYQAKGSRSSDAKKIGIGAGAGAVIGGLLGGKKGAGAGAAIGGGAGTAMVLTTAGDEVKLRAGTTVELSLSQPLTLLIPMS